MNIRERYCDESYFVKQCAKISRNTDDRVSQYQTTKGGAEKKKIVKSEMDIKAEVVKSRTNCVKKEEPKLGRKVDLRVLLKYNDVSYNILFKKV